MLKKFKPLKPEKYWALVLNEGATPVEINYSSSFLNTILFENGSRIGGGCINCLDKPCWQYNSHEIDINVLSGFPYNNDRRVCPSDAIQVLEEGGVEIVAGKCISCGICVQRCPSGGIKYNSEGIFAVGVMENTDMFTQLKAQDSELQQKTMSRFKNASESVSVAKISRVWAKYFRDKFIEISHTQADLEHVLVRNFLLNIGISNQISAIGNIDIRFDFIATTGDFLIPGESELVGNDILGLPRRILDDIAVLHSRYNIPKDSIIPLLILFLFPRKRSDFYEVLTDIREITGFEVKVFPIHFLFLLNLFNVSLDSEDFLENFIINKDTQDYGEYTKRYISDIETIDDNYGTELYTFEK